MDPYLEDPELWPDVHHRLAVALAELLEPPLRGRYRVFVERRMYARAPEGTPEGTQRKLRWGRPDICVAEEQQQAAYACTPAATADAVGPLRVRLPAAELESEPFLEIRDAPSGRVVTVVEILSPSNKTPGDGRRAYLDKRAVLFGASVNLVEIDLLRGGEPMPVWPAVQPGAYGILVSRAELFPEAELYRFTVRQPIPAFRLPLRAGDAEPAVSVRAALDRAYDGAGYRFSLNYDAPPPAPPLSPADSAWVRSRLTTLPLAADS